MSFINYLDSTINIKVVYCGPVLSGKTANLVYVYERTNPKAKGKMISLATETGRTKFFDFLPLTLGKIRGFETRFHIYSVPGAVFSRTSRELALKGVDGVVFVADSQRDRLEANRHSFEDIEEILRVQGKTWDDVPCVVQWNKRDLPNTVPLNELETYINSMNFPSFEACATGGSGVFDTLKGIAKLTVTQLKRREATETATTATTPPQRVIETPESIDEPELKAPPPDWQRPLPKDAGEPQSTHLVARYLFPYPLAVLYRLSQSSHLPADRFNLSIKFIEGAFRFLALVATADALHGNTPRNDVARDWLQLLCHPGLGKLGLLLSKAHDHLRASSSGFIEELTSLLTTGSDWEAAASELVGLRNRYTHDRVYVPDEGARPLLDSMREPLRVFVGGLRFLKNYQLGVFKGGSFRGSDGLHSFYWYPSVGQEELCENVRLRGNDPPMCNIFGLLKPATGQILYLAPFFYWGLTDGDQERHLFWLQYLDRGEGDMIPLRDAYAIYQHPLRYLRRRCLLPHPDDPEGIGTTVGDYLATRAEWPHRQTLGLDERSRAVLLRHHLPFDLGERYETKGKLGEGAMGVVWEVYDRLLKRGSAVKVLRPEYARQPEALERFIREACALTQIDHPGVVKFHEVSAGPDGSPFIEMALVDGENLGEWVAHHGPLSALDACTVLAQVLDALQSIHDAGFVHRDVKPSNILISEDPERGMRRVFVVDFGIVRHTDNQDLTKPMETMGTPGYMDENQKKGFATKQSDLFAVGQVLFFALTGHRPSSDDSCLESAPCDVSAAVKAIYEQATHRDPQKQFSTAREMAAAFRRAAEETSVTLKRESK